MSGFKSQLINLFEWWVFLMSELNGHLLFLDVEDHIEKHGHMREVPSCALCGLVET